jgi:chromosome segregation ATPase
LSNYEESIQRDRDSLDQNQKQYNDKFAELNLLNDQIIQYRETFNSAKSSLAKIDKERIAINDRIKEVNEKVHHANVEVKTHTLSVKQVRIATTDI